MKVLIINVNSHTGSTGKITKGLYDYLKTEGHEVKVGYRGVLESQLEKDDFIPLISKWEFGLSVALARITGLEGHFSFFATLKLKRLIRYFKPDVIQLYNAHGNYIRTNAFLDYVKKKGIPVVYSMLDEYAYMGKCPYPRECDKFKTKCYRCPQKREYPESWLFDTTNILFHQKEHLYNGFQRIIFTGPPFVCKRAKESFLLKNKRVEELYEPFNFKESFYPRNTDELRKELGLDENDRVVVCASGTSPRKGGKYFLEVARILKDQPNLKFIFIGYDRNDWDFPENVIVKGFIPDPDKLASYISVADSYVCTSIGDSTPSICLAALGCGTPLIGFDYDGIKDCAPNEFGTYVPLGDVVALAQVVVTINKKTSKDIERIRSYAVRQFSSESIYKKQVEIYHNLLVNKDFIS